MDILSTPVNPGIIEFRDYNYLAITGDKTNHFLQGQLTCDVSLLTAEKALLGAYLSVQGRVITSLRLIQHKSQLLLQLPSNISEVVYSKLNRIAALSRVKLQFNHEIQTVGILGSNVTEKLQTYFSSTPTAPMQALHEHDLMLLRITKEEQFMVIGTAQSINHFKQKVILPEISDSNWQLSLIKAGLVEIDATTTEHFTPHEIDLPGQNAVSFTKGCYVGQEIVARMQYLGKLKQHLQLLQWQTPPVCQILDKVFNQEQRAAGQIAAIASHKNQQVALVVLRDDAIKTALYTKDNTLLL